MSAKKIINPATEYYIVSLKHTGKKDKYITLWRPNNKGYCWPVDMAGIYKGYIMLIIILTMGTSQLQLRISRCYSSLSMMKAGSASRTARQ